MTLGRKLLVGLPALVLLVLVAVSFVYLSRGGSSVAPSVLVGGPVPQFSLEGYDAEHPGLSDADLRQGSVTLVNVFASWCAPCIAELPHLNTLAEEHGLTIHAIAWKDKPEDMAAVFARHGNPFRRIGMDDEGRAVIGWGIQGVPETFVVSGDGTIIHHHLGDIRPEQIAGLVEVVRNAQK